MRISVPASSANLGPGFDVLGLALALPFELADDPALLPGVDPDVPAGDGHPAVVAFRGSGGTGVVWVRTAIPPARGLGFSGAARVAGALAAHVQRGEDPVAARPAVLAATAALEGHPDNAAPSTYGGFTVAAAGHCVPVPWRLPTDVTVWIPEERSGTDESRRALPATLPFADAVFNVGRAALLVAAIATGDVGVLRAATEDRLHQDVRLAHLPGSRAALAGFLAAGAVAAWLSGSGPTVAAILPPGATPELPDGTVRALAVDVEGASVVDA